MTSSEDDRRTTTPANPVSRQAAGPRQSTQRVVGKYRLRQLLGRGGMGEVYLGEHELLGRSAAVKLLSPRLTGNEEALARFFREAVATSQIKHPGIAHIYDYGKEEGGPAFIVMELLDGETLRQRINRLGKLSVCRAAALGSQIAGVLDSAHKNGIVHRDLKPANIFVVADSDVPGGERAKVLDFGIAKLSENDDAFTELTASGAILGTPVFMSPEQCRSRRDVDAPSDVYTLGCVLYRMVAGRPPFDFDSVGELIVAHCTREPAPLPPSVSAPRRFELLLRRMMAKDPSDRPSADVVRSQLEAVVAAGPISAPPSVPPRNIEDATTEIAALSSNSVDNLMGRATPFSGQYPMTEVDPATRIGGQTALGTVPGTDSAELEQPPGDFTRGLANRPVRLDPRYARTVGVGERRAGKPKRSLALIGLGAAIVFGLAILVLSFADSGDGPKDSRALSRETSNVKVTSAQRNATGKAVAAPTEAAPADAPSAVAQEPATAPAEAPVLVEIEIRSKPAGAAVRLVPRGEPLGVTPLLVRRHPSALPLIVWLSRDGYRTSKVTIEQSDEKTYALKRKRRRPAKKVDPLARP